MAPIVVWTGAATVFPRFLRRRMCLSGIATLCLLSCVQSLNAQIDLLPVYRFQRLVVPPDGPKGEIVRDGWGFVWIGRADGLETYDGYSTRYYGHVERDPFSLAPGNVASLLSDSEQRVWVGTGSSCLSLYDRSRDRFFNFPIPGSDSSSNPRGAINAIVESRAGNLWLATDFGIVRAEIVANPGSENPDTIAPFIRFTEFQPGTPRNIVFDLCERNDARVIAASDSGLLIFDPLTQSFTRPNFPDPIGRRLNTIPVSSLAQDAAGDLWLGTKTEGVFHVAWETGKVWNFRHREGDSLSISDDNIRDLTLDRSGDLWIGTIKGIDLFSPVAGRRIPYLAFNGGPVGNYSVSLSVDSTGTLWVTTHESAYWLSQRSRNLPWYSLLDDNGRMELFMTIEKDDEKRVWLSSVVSDFVSAVDIQALRVLKRMKIYPGGIVEPPYVIHQNWTLIDRRGTYWTAAQSLGLYELNLTTGHVMAYDFMPASYSRPHHVASIARGSGDSIWVAAREDGLMMFDTRTKKFSQVPQVKEYVVNVMQDGEGLVWLAAGDQGVVLFDPITGTTTRFAHVDSDPRSLSDGSVRSIIQDSLGRIWVGAGNSVDLWNSASRSFTRYPNLTFADSWGCLPMRADRAGRLWIAYPEAWAISILDPTTGNFTDLDSSRGFWQGIPVDMETLPDGKIVLAGAYGISVFNPDSINVRRPPPPLVITRMAINDTVGIPPSVLDGAARLLLSHAQNMLEFEFAAIDIDAPSLVQYRYRLEGLEKDWLRPRDRRYVRYTGLPPGEYVFRVRASSAYGEWPDQEIAIAISIAPPWWRTWWAYAVYGIAIVGSLYAGYRQRLRQVRLQQQAQLEHLQSEHLAEMDRVKSRFFTNISHEFRTPLTLILGPARQLMEGSSEEDTRIKADLIHRSARKLNRLVDELLDIARIEAGEMKLSASPVNVISTVNDTVLAFQPLAESKKITCRSRCEENEIIAYLDREKMDKILGNVLSNAFKFTPEGGRVEVVVESRPSSKGSAVTISIADTGIGIPKDRLGMIFDRFYQVDGSHTREHEGTGIGLALTKELVELHKGRIEVESEEGKGSTFRLVFPLGKAHLKPEEIGVVEAGHKQEAPVQRLADNVVIVDPHGGEGGVSDRAESPSVLVVEDSSDVRAYIASILKDTYRIIEAGDGEEGLEMSMRCIPDFIITDIMMPKIDGFQLCGKLKADPRTSHIPVIMLTAKATAKDKISGLETGADDYIVKPFEAQELKARIRNLLEQRRRLHEHFRRNGLVDMGGQSVTSVDQRFLQKAANVVIEHIADTSFSVEVFADVMAVSRSLLFRKMEALLGEPPSEFIKRTRLSRAAQLIESKTGNVSEVALEVGFNNPSYFAECFRKQFGQTPTQYSRRFQQSPSEKAGPHPH